VGVCSTLWRCHNALSDAVCGVASPTTAWLTRLAPSFSRAYTPYTSGGDDVVGGVVEHPDKGFSSRTLPIKLSAVHSTLQINLPSVEADIVVKGSNILDRIRLDILSGDRISHSGAFLFTQPSEHSVELREIPGHSGLPSLASSLAPLQVTAWIPVAMCDVSIDTNGGTVSVEKLEDAGLELKTRGGDVHVTGLSAGKYSRIDAAGGKVTGSFTAAEIDVTTSGTGSVHLGKVMGNQVAISTDRGDLRAAFLYGQNLEASSKAADIDITNFHAENSGRIVAFGRLVHLGGVQGSVHVSSRGGDVQLQLEKRLHKVKVDSEGGTVRLSLSPSIAADADLHAAAGIETASKHLLCFHGQGKGPIAGTPVFTFSGGSWPEGVPQITSWTGQIYGSHCDAVAQDIAPGALGREERTHVHEMESTAVMMDGAAEDTAASCWRPDQTRHGHRYDDEANGGTVRGTHRGRAVVDIDAGGGIIQLEGKNWLEAIKDRFGANQWSPYERERFKKT